MARVKLKVKKEGYKYIVPVLWVYRGYFAFDSYDGRIYLVKAGKIANSVPCFARCEMYEVFSNKKKGTTTIVLEATETVQPDAEVFPIRYVVESGARAFRCNIFEVVDGRIKYTDDGILFSKIEGPQLASEVGEYIHGERVLIGVKPVQIPFVELLPEDLSL